jgi:hypothetical protein
MHFEIWRTVVSDVVAGWGWAGGDQETHNMCGGCLKRFRGVFWIDMGIFCRKLGREGDEVGSNPALARRAFIRVGALTPCHSTFFVRIIEFHSFHLIVSESAVSRSLPACESKP